MEGIAIIILNYRNYPITIKCVEDLINKGIKEKIIVVDNNSPNDSYEVIKIVFKNFSNIEVIKSTQNGGYARGNNIGIIRAIELGYEYIAIMNPDVCIGKSNTLQNLVNNMKKHNLDGITAIPITNDGYIFDTIAWKIPQFTDLVYLNSAYIKAIKNPIAYNKLNMLNTKDAIGEIEVMPGCFFILTSKCFKDINYFDENTFLYYEENILSIKAKKKGYIFGVALNEFYLHNHLEKDTNLNAYCYKYRDRKILLESQKYYAKEYLRLNKFKLSILNLSQFANIYIELPINHIIKRVISKIRRKYE